MKDFNFLMNNFFTHKDYLPPADQIPGTLFTPLHFVFEAIVLLFLISSAVYVSKRKHLIKPVFTGILFTLLALEVAIVTWDSVAGKTIGFDLTTNLSLYPCSIFMYVMPFAIWGKGNVKKAACGYVCTLGLLGALINFIYPIARLMDYSCISFAAFHTFIYHGCMLFTCLVMLMSGYHRFTGVTRWWQMFLASLPGLLMSIPANIINYSPIQADYMYFTGQHFIVANIFKNSSPIQITCILYVLYLIVPACFYLPSWVCNKVKASREERVTYTVPMQDMAIGSGEV